MTNQLPSSYVFHIIFCEDSNILNVNGKSHPLIFGPYSVKKMVLPGTILLNMSIGYQFRIADEKEFIINLISPSGKTISNIPLGEILTSESKRYTYSKDTPVYGEMNLISGEALNVEEAGVYVFSVQLRNEEVTRIYLTIDELEDEENTHE